MVTFVKKITGPLGEKKAIWTELSNMEAAEATPPARPWMLRCAAVCRSIRDIAGGLGDKIGGESLIFAGPGFQNWKQVWTGL